MLQQTTEQETQRREYGKVWGQLLDSAIAFGCEAQATQILQTAVTAKHVSPALIRYIQSPTVANALALAEESLKASAVAVDQAHLAAQVAKERVDYLLTVYQQGRPVDPDLVRVIPRQQRTLVDKAGDARRAFADVLPKPPAPEPAPEGERPDETF